MLDLAVHPDYRKRGIAKMLLTDAIEELRLCGCRFFYLEVRVSNHAAKKLYKGLGFRTVGTRKGYYMNPVEDAVLMMREL
ncbi:MAG: hypothetical protein A2077_05525 [Nitrospirae bacterium GWC2_46_6]|nr:MAG: hypothetical protein A2077_05525 [Nitrospirae bacterium GWC2_46_6]